MNHQENQKVQASSQQVQTSTPTKFSYELTVIEILLIERIRNFDYGIIEVHKLNDEITRTVKKVNETFDQAEGLKILKGVSKNDR